MKLLLDEQISGKVAQRLADRGHDVTAVVADPALRGLSDPELFELAQGEKRAVVTYNYVDFIGIAQDYGSRGQTHHGLVIVHPTKLPGWELARLTNELARLLEKFAPYSSFYVWIPLS